MTKKNTLSTFAAIVFASSFGLTAQAQTTFIKANNNTSLNFASSYTANTTVPTELDTVRVDTTLTGSTTAALGGNLSIFALTSNATSQFQISATANATLTIGAGGITKNNGAAALLVASAVALSANQTWTLTGGGGTQNFQLNSTSFNANGHTLAVSGNSTLDIRTLGSLTLGSTVTIDTSVSINGNSTTTDVTFGGSNTNNTLNIVAGKLRGNTIGNFGVASAFGDGGTNTAIALGGGNVGQNGLMVYTGNNISSNRTINRDARSVASGIEVTTAGQTLTISGNLGSGNQVNVLGSGWAFSGAGNLTLTGVISNSSNGSSTGGTTVTKTGTGTLTLSGNNTFSGNTQVNEGTLLVNNTVGSGTGTGEVTVASGATLGGNGTISGATTVNGIIAPGNSIGTLNVVNTLTWNSNDAWKFELGRCGRKKSGIF